jgi:hypothetical protein
MPVPRKDRASPLRKFLSLRLGGEGARQNWSARLAPPMSFHRRGMHRITLSAGPAVRFGQLQSKWFPSRSFKRRQNCPSPRAPGWERRLCSQFQSADKVVAVSRRCRPDAGGVASRMAMASATFSGHEGRSRSFTWRLLNRRQPSCEELWVQ